MTRASLRESAAIQRARSRQATRAEKPRRLDEVVRGTGLHRKAAIRLLRRPPRGPPLRPRTGRPRVYGPGVAAATEGLWEAAGRIGPQRLQPFGPELLDRLIQCEELPRAPEVETWLRQASPATRGRLLAPARATPPPRGAVTTRPGTGLKGQIPLRPFTAWADARPGFLAVALVAHGGTSPEGVSLWTLCAVDIATAWIDLEAVWGQGQARVGGAVQPLPPRLPMPLLGLDRDTGSACINRGLFDSCRRHGITVPRRRAYKKNASAHVEQKNGAIVRRWIGSDRSATKAASAHRARVYRLVRLHVHVFQPVQKRVEKTRHGAKVRRRDDRAQTPSQRLCAPDILSPAKPQELEALSQSLNPLQLRRQTEAELERLWTLATPDPSRSPEPPERMETPK